MSENELKLTEDELLKLKVARLESDLSHVTRELRAAKIESFGLKQKLNEQDNKLLNYEITALSKEMAALNSKKKLSDDEYVEIIAAVRERLGIEGRFGYNEDTLEIILEEK